MKYRNPTMSSLRGHRILIYDDDCGVCYKASLIIQRWARHPLDLVAFSELPGAGLLEDLSPEEVLASAHYVTPEGVEFHGGQAMTRAVRLVPGGWLFRVLDLPGISLIRDLGYSLFAANRRLVSRLTGQQACLVRTPVDGQSTSAERQ